MPVPFVGRFSQAGMRARVSVGVSSISIDAFDTTIGTKQVTIRASGPGVTHVGWTVYRNVPPTYDWYDAGHDNIALVGGAVTVTVETFAVGDRVKAYKTAATGGAASRDLTLTADSDYATAPPGTDPDPPGSTGPVAILSRMGLGINQERSTAATHTGARAAPYYQRYRDNGIRQVRFFPPVGTLSGATIPLDPDEIGTVQVYLDAAMACVQSGMPVTVFDCTDTLEYSNMGSALYDYVQAVAERVAEMEFPADRFIIGAVGLWGGGNNGAYQPHRFTCNQRLRTALPNHTIVEGPCHWKNPRALFAPNDPGTDGLFGTYVPWSDLNTMQDVHHYNDWDLNGLVSMAEQCATWSTANGGRKVFAGEWGFDSFQHEQDVQRQITRFNAHSGQLAIAKLRPILWAVTDSNSFRMNDVGGNLFRPGFDSAVPGWATEIDGLVAGTNPPPPPPPPPPPTNDDVLNIVIRGANNALLFADLGGMWTMHNRVQELTGRTVNINWAWEGGTGHWSIFADTPFLTAGSTDGWADSGRQESLRQYLTELTAEQREAPFVMLWMHNEDDAENHADYSQADWVAAVRADATIMRDALGLSAAQCRYVFLKVRHNAGNPTKIYAGMAELAADGTFNASVSDAALAAGMDNDGTPNGAHLSSHDANNIIAPALADQLAALYPGP